MWGWLVLGGFNAIVADLGVNHGAWTVSVLLAARHFLSSVGLV
jgi:hypothetical protein